MVGSAIWRALEAKGYNNLIGARSGELETWNKKYGEVMEALDRAEALWLAASEKLEAATG